MDPLGHDIIVAPSQPLDGAAGGKRDVTVVCYRRCSRRLLPLRRELDNLAALVGRNPFCIPPKAARYIELDYLRHNYLDAY
jgi:hypothetical protein